MSFIFKNDELIKTLLKEGQDFKKKYSQAVPSATPATPITNPLLNDAQKKVLDAYRLAAPMIAQLQRKIDPANAPAAPSALGNEGNNEIFAKDLRTLGDLLRWAAVNKKTWNGQRFAWLKGESDIKKDAWVFKAMSDDRSKRSEEDIYADKSNTIDFLTMLRDSKEAKENTVFKVMLSKAISDINQQLVAANQSAIPTKSDKSKNSLLNPEAIVDGFDSDVFDGTTPLEGIGEAPLFTNASYKLQIKHLNDYGSFNRWMQSRRVKIGNDSLGVLDPNSNPCIAINILYKRAKYLLTVAPGQEEDSPGYTKFVEFYMKKIQEYGPKFTFNDKPCSVIIPNSSGTSTNSAGSDESDSGSNSNNKNKPGSNSSEQDSNSEERNTKIATSYINIIDSLPFKVEDLDFGRIDDFFQEFGKIQGTNNQLPGYLSEYQRHRDRAKSCLAIPSKDNFDMSMTPVAVGAQLKNPPMMYYMNFLNACIDAINSTKGAISLLRRQATPYLKYNPQAFEKVAAQIGTNPGDYSIANRNMESLSVLKSQFKPTSTDAKI